MVIVGHKEVVIWNDDTHLETISIVAQGLIVRLEVAGCCANRYFANKRGGSWFVPHSQLDKIQHGFVVAEIVCNIEKITFRKINIFPFESIKNDRKFRPSR